MSQTIEVEFLVTKVVRKEFVVGMGADCSTLSSLMAEDEEIAHFVDNIGIQRGVISVELGNVRENIYND